MRNVTIRDIKVILTAPADVDLVAVKVETDEPGLYGWGCATFTQRYESVATVVREYLKPLLVGRNVNQIEEIWQLAMSSSYWRNGPVLNNAISGVDEALWDIKGKMAGMPLYELLGGKVRAGVPAYRYAEGDTLEELAEDVRRHMDRGYQHLRFQINTSWNTPGALTNIPQPSGVPEGAYFDANQTIDQVIERFRFLRETFGNKVEFLYDVHERLAPVDALRLAKLAEPYRPFYLEDILPPEQSDWLSLIRSQSAVPMAMGELFIGPGDWMPLITSHQIDYIRCHISMIGGISPARKLAALCEAHGVRTAWHGPYDLTPIGMAAQLHLDMVIPNLGIQEFYGYTEQERQVFNGCPEFKDGFLYVRDTPGLGVDVDEKAAAAFPCRYRDPKWVHARRPDGTVVRP